MLGRVKERHPGSGVAGIGFFALCCFMFRVYFRLTHSARFDGTDRIPDRGPVLLIANHQSYYDPPFIGCWITRRQLDFLARGSLFKFKPFAWLLKTVHTMPIKQGAGDTGAMKEALRRLGEGRAMLVFPEGSRTRDGSISPFERGTALLLKRAHCTIIPVGISGAYEAWPRHKRLPRPFSGRIAVVYGDPISSDTLVEHGADEAMRRLHAEVEALAVRAMELRRR